MAKDRTAYESYDGFLKAAIKAYWESGQRNRVTFLALLFACRETWSVAWEKGTAPGAGKKMLTGAAGAAAAAVLIRAFLGGPIGLLLGGASIASLAALYVRNHDRIWKKVARFRGLIEIYEEKYDALKRDAKTGVISNDHRDLMIDGLMSRFLTELDSGPEDEPEVDDEDGPETGSFAAHVAKAEAAIQEAEEREAAAREAAEAAAERATGEAPKPRDKS